MMKEDILDHFQNVRIRVVIDHYESKITDTELLTKLRKLVDMETDTLAIMSAAKKMSLSREN